MGIKSNNVIIALKRQLLTFIKVGWRWRDYGGIFKKKYKYTLNMKINKKKEPYTWKKKASWNLPRMVLWILPIKFGWKTCKQAEIVAR